MRHNWVRRVFIGLILAFPLLMSVAASPSERGVRSALPIVAVELVLVGGLLFARRERRRLLVELEVARTAAPSRVIVSRPSAALVNAKPTAWRSISGSPGV